MRGVPQGAADALPPQTGGLRPARAVLPQPAPKWKAEALQLVNWGGFHGYARMPVSPAATLLSGASGTSKSTILDAYLAHGAVRHAVQRRVQRRHHRPGARRRP